MIEVIGMNQGTSIFLVFCAFLFGIALGGFIASFLQDRKADNQTAESPPDDLLRVRKDADSGALQVFVVNRGFHTPAEMTPDQRALTGYIVNDLQAWLSPQAAAGKSMSTAIPEAITPAALVVAAGSLAPSSPGTPSVPMSGVSVENQTPDEPKKRKRGGIMGMVTNALKAEVSTAKLPPKSIAVQVNEILQAKLKGSPLEERGICLMELPGQDMVVMIGLDKYDSVNAVPDDEIRAVIQLAVNDWLKKSA
jgi:hypothetical protein